MLQDAYGPIRRGLVQESCGTAQTAEQTLLAEPYLRTALPAHRPAPRGQDPGM